MKAVAPSPDPLAAIDAKTGCYPGMAPYDPLKGTPGRRKRGRVLGRKGLESHFYHLMSRTCGGEVWFDDTEKEALTRLILKMSRFCGVDVLTFCVMGNHFHILARVPDKETWMRQFEGDQGEKALLEHLGRFYSRSFMNTLRFQLSQDRRLGNEESAQGRLLSFKDRLCDVSAFMKELKLRFSKWFNKRHGRQGTLWMERFKSVLVEGQTQGPRGGHRGDAGQVDALRMMALYIDLNPVRAGLVKSPAEYRWCGYAAALAGDRRLREGLLAVTRQRSWVKAGARYGSWLSAILETEADQAQAGASDRAEAPPAHQGWSISPPTSSRLVERSCSSLHKKGWSLHEFLRCRVRYFSDGKVIGSKAFVADYRRRDDADARRVPLIRELRENRLYSMRQLRLRPLAPSGP